VKSVFFAAALLLAAPAAFAGGDCSRTSVGFTPLNDLGAGFHQGFQGGLYPGGSNVHPDTATGLAIARSIGPLDNQGNPSESGKYVLISIGMSNTTQEFKPFLEAARVDEARDPALVVIDGAQGGWVGDKITDPAQNEVYWGRIANRLAKAGRSHEQVAVAWVKTAHDTERDHADEEFPADAEALRATMRSLAQLLLVKFPNLKLAYFSTRTYAGYAVTELSPEPHAWQGGFAAKWLIESQIMGVPELNNDPAHGAVNAPFLLWGPYLWADGLTPRGDGLTWACADFMDDGTHPSPSGRQKVADALWQFVRTDPTAREWYLTDTPNAAPTRARGKRSPMRERLKM
jgi:lysophospholipase L1-like esterase